MIHLYGNMIRIYGNRIKILEKWFRYMEILYVYMEIWYVYMEIWYKFLETSSAVLAFIRKTINKQLNRFAKICKGAVPHNINMICIDR